MDQQIGRVGDWPAKSQSLYFYLADWCDFTAREARAEVARRMIEDCAAGNPPRIITDIDRLAA